MDTFLLAALWIGMRVDDVLSAFWLWGPLALPLVVGGCCWALRPTGRRRRPRLRRLVLPSRRSTSAEATTVTAPVTATDTAPDISAEVVSAAVADSEGGTPGTGDADTIAFAAVTYPPPPVDVPRADLFERAEEVRS